MPPIIPGIAGTISSPAGCRTVPPKPNSHLPQLQGRPPRGCTSSHHPGGRRSPGISASRITISQFATPVLCFALPYSFFFAVLCFALHTFAQSFLFLQFTHRRRARFWGRQPKSSSLRARPGVRRLCTSYTSHVELSVLLCNPPPPTSPHKHTRR